MARIRVQWLRFTVFRRKLVYHFRVLASKWLYGLAKRIDPNKELPLIDEERFQWYGEGRSSQWRS